VPSRFSASALITISRRIAATIPTMRNGLTVTDRRAMATRIVLISSVKMNTGSRPLSSSSTRPVKESRPSPRTKSYRTTPSRMTPPTVRAMATAASIRNSP
jgi:hypothetical protein